MLPHFLQRGWQSEELLGFEERERLKTRSLFLHNRGKKGSGNYKYY
jgi:hypothetical protein